MQIRNILTRLRLLIATVGLAIACSGQAADLPGKGVTVQPLKSSIAEETFQTLLVMKALERLGYDVKPIKEIEYAAGHIAIANGDATFLADHWDPLHKDFYIKAGGDKKIFRKGVYSSGALQGYLIDKKTAEEYGITTLSQIVEDPELSALFDTDGDGVADLQGCNEGWGCAENINTTIEINNWQDKLTHVQGEYSLLITDAIARYERGEPILYYTWTPNFTVAQLKPGEDVVWLGLGATIPEGQEGAASLEEGQCAADPCEMGFVPADIRVVANNEFMDANPAARALFEAVTIPPEDIFAQNLEMNEGADTQEDIEDQAAAWIDENREQVEEWLEEARSAAA